MMIGLIVHRYNLAIASTCQDSRTEPPLHHGLVARMLAPSALQIAAVFELQGAQADAEWERLARVVVHTGKDPNWRSKPSVLDQLRGWKSVPRPKKSLRRTAA